MPAHSPTWEPPRPFRPATAIRTVLLAPRTRPEDLVPAMVIAPAAASVVLRKERRDRLMTTPFGRREEAWRQLEAFPRLYPLASHLARRERDLSHRKGHGRYWFSSCRVIPRTRSS